MLINLNNCLIEFIEISLFGNTVITINQSLNNYKLTIYLWWWCVSVTQCVHPIRHYCDANVRKPTDASERIVVVVFY